jgi:hypothetical protein
MLSHLFTYGYLFPLLVSLLLRQHRVGGKVHTDGHTYIWTDICMDIWNEHPNVRRLEGFGPLESDAQNI